MDPLGAFPGAPFNLRPTALALWLLEQGQQLGAEVPVEWKGLTAIAARRRCHPSGGRTPEAALALLGDGEGWAAWMEGLVAKSDQLLPPQEAFLALVLSQASTPCVPESPPRWSGPPRFRAGGRVGDRRLLAGRGAHPGLAGLDRRRDHRPRRAPAGQPSIGDGMRHLLQANNQEAWTTGVTGALLPLALSAGRRATPDRGARIELTDGAGL